MQRLGDFFTRLTRRLLPDPMVLACLLTIFVIAVGICAPQIDELRSMSIARRPIAVAGIWLGAVWNAGFLTFALQMCVVLLTGFGLARAPLALRGLKRLASLARSNRSAVLLIGLTSCVGCWINWGFGLILAGLLATEIRRQMRGKGIGCQYGLIVAAAYAGMMIWHGGFSGSAPLKAASDGGFAIEVRDGDSIRTESVPAVSISGTTLSAANLGLAAVLIIGVPLALAAMGRRKVEIAGDETEPTHEEKEPDVVEQRARKLADVLNESRVLSLTIATLILVVLGRRLVAEGTDAVDLNFVNSLFLGLGLALHRNLLTYIAAVTEGGRSIVGIVIQFPLYSGIQGVMFGTGLAAAISQSFVGASVAVADVLHVGVEHTFPVATFFSAGLVNLFVPSGGGQWIVQGPIMCGAAQTLGTSFEQTIMAIAYGDQLTNMIQPFWAIPLIGMTRVSAREFMGYCALLMLLAIPVFVVALLMY